MLTHLVSVNQKDVLGKRMNHILDDREDLRIFREKTFHKVIIMGRKSYEKVKNLKHRTFVVLTSRPLKNKDGVYFVQTLDKAISLAKEVSEPGSEIYIAGGKSIYEQTLPQIEKIYLTQINDIQNGRKHYKVPDNFKIRELLSRDFFTVYVYDLIKK